MRSPIQIDNFSVLIDQQVFVRAREPTIQNAREKKRRRICKNK
jgi:hypothetical protein